MSSCSSPLSECSLMRTKLASLARPAETYCCSTFIEAGLVASNGISTLERLLSYAITGLTRVALGPSV